MSRRWWRTNRYWLPLAPLALVAMLAASSYHVRGFWYLRGEHHAVATAQPGRSAYVVLPYTDTEGRTAYRFRVRLEGLTRVNHLTDALGDPTAVPGGTTAYQVRLAFSADPAIAMPACVATIVDSDGRTYQTPSSLDADPACTPPGHPGPDPAVFRGQRRGAVDPGDERPPTWTTAPEVLVARGARPVEVRLSLGDPDYVSLPIR